MRFTVFPNILPPKVGRRNPYIQDYISAIEEISGNEVVNSTHKNPLLSILSPKKWGNIFIFNWFENIPDFKYGLLQSVTAIVYLHVLKLSGAKIIWMLHNKLPHAKKKMWLKKKLMSLIAKKSDLIITHSLEGLDIVRNNYPYALNKSHYLDHPTKNRLANIKEESLKSYDLLIWGNVAQYKGITEFIDYLVDNSITDISVCIIGRFSSEELYNNVKEKVGYNVTVINDSPSFEELGEYINSSYFVLAPYYPESVLSSGMLMDSLSFGARVIGPNAGSFNDYTKEKNIEVYTFDKYDDILSIVRENREPKVSLSSYNEFLNERTWPKFIEKLMLLLKGNK